VVCDTAVHREATGGTNREGHRSLAGREAYCRRDANDGARPLGAEVPRSNFVVVWLVTGSEEGVAGREVSGGGLSADDWSTGPPQLIPSCSCFRDGDGIAPGGAVYALSGVFSLPSVYNKTRHGQKGLQGSISLSVGGLFLLKSEHIPSRLKVSNRGAL